MADREERDAAQKAKFIFLSVTGLVVVLLMTSFLIATRARSERDALKAELEACKQDGAKLTLYLDEQTKEIDKLKKQVEMLQAKAKAKPAAKAKTAPRSTKRKSSRSK